MKVSIVELDYHAEVMRNTLSILKGRDFQLKVFSNAAIWKKVAWAEEVELHLLEPTQSADQFIEAKASLINDSDLILINTVASNFKAWSQFRFKAPVLLRIHNANANFNRLPKNYQMIWQPFFLWKDLSHFLRKILGEGEARYQKLFFSRIDHFAFPNADMRQYALNHYPLKAENCWSLPFSFWEELNPPKKPEAQKVQISIIGKIDRRNRDYEKVLKAFAIIVPQLTALNLQLELCLLGKAQGRYAKQILKAFKSLESAHFKLKAFRNFIPQEEFEAKIQNTDFLIIPTRIETRFTIYKEYYGSTKISGSVNDVIRYHRFALIEGSYPVPESIKEAFSAYSDPTDLAHQVLMQLQERGYTRKDFARILADYKIENIRKHYYSVFNAISS